MYHYTIKVPSAWGVSVPNETIKASISNETCVAPVSKETIINRLAYFNDSGNYLLYDGGNEAEKRFIMVSSKKVNKTMLSELKDIFEAPVTAEEINVKTIDHKTLKKIHAIKGIMADHNYYDDSRRNMLVTETAEQLIHEVDAMLGFSRFKSFFRGFAGFIDRTAELRAKAMYNVILVNKCGACLDSHIELLFGLLSAKGILTEQVMVAGDVYSTLQRERETRCVNVISESWDVDDNTEVLKASDEVKLFSKIRKSDNIYITSMTQKEYDKLQPIACFSAAFPNVVVIEELTPVEKLAYICNIADEYGFAVNREGFVENKLIINSSLEDIEIAIRRAVVGKLASGSVDGSASGKVAATDYGSRNAALSSISSNAALTAPGYVAVSTNPFVIDISDIDIKAKKSKKVSAFAELESLIGLEGVKRTVKEIVTFVKKRGKDAVPCLHMCFLGNPGTAKTTVARILARILFEAGIIKRDLLVETDRGGLIGLYVGHTADKTAAKIESALGGVLFIDEAYSLFAGESKVDYGHEAVATLVKGMEDKRGEFVCILAGYTDEMNDMLNMNPGLRDRVQFYVDFPDYNGEELLEIFEKLCRDNKYKLSESGKDSLSKCISRILLAKSQNSFNGNSQNFSNGRLIRKLFERVRMKQALRASNSVITGEDVEAVFGEADIAALLNGSGRGRIGFGV